MTFIACRYQKMSDLCAKMITSSQRKVVTMTNIQELLAKNILDRYTPFAFTCECGGTHGTCSQSRQDVFTYAQYDTVRRIVDYIQNFNPDL